MFFSDRVLSLNILYIKQGVILSFQERLNVLAPDYSKPDNGHDCL